jgi:hypothetical protein
MGPHEGLAMSAWFLRARQGQAVALGHGENSTSCARRSFYSFGPSCSMEGRSVAVPGRPSLYRKRRPRGRGSPWGGLGQPQTPRPACQATTEQRKLCDDETRIQDAGMRQVGPNGYNWNG